MAIWDKIKPWILQIVFFVAIWGFVQWLYTQKLLDTGEYLPEFTLHSMAGESISDSDLRGKPTLIYFFAPWCGVCHFSIDSVESIKQEHEQLNVIAIALDFEEVKEIEEFVSDHELTIPVLLGNRDTAMNFRVSAFPTYYTIDNEGRIVAKDMGVSTRVGLWLRTWLAR
ncbi:TlpA family protein disulfide reductase [Corallincola platygyrae]|uniref:TlpA family protein disulfide reductase n=1 Tax=Corallincola platygyrae TaxID=1193278 RepID=A0ABW4XJQ6_9GAMM